MPKNLDLMLINAGGSRKRVYQVLSADYAAIEPPFWAALTAGFFRKRGFEISLLDANVENLSAEETARRVEEANPNLTNIVVYGQHPSASTQLMTSVGNLCTEIKKQNPERKIILTGLHPSALPERTLREESCDYVAEGEGFYTLDGFLQNGDLGKIPGLWFRENGEIVHNPKAKNIADLTQELGDVAWDLLPLKSGDYRACNHQCLGEFEKRPHYASLSTSLGCPFKCDFCAIHKTFGERKMRFWEPKWAVDQIQKLKEEYGVKVFKIIDEMFVLNQNHYLGIANELIARDLGKEINIWAYARVDTVKKENLQKMRKAGFKWFCFGFESGNEKILQQVHKGNYTRKDMVDISRMVRDSGIGILANYMFGFPEDTKDTMQQTLDLAMEQRCEFVNLYSACAWPGSTLYDSVLKQKQRLPEKWEDYAQHAYGFIPLPTNHLTPEEVLEFRDKAFNTYFKNPEYLSMIEKQFGMETRNHIEGMTKNKLKRKILKK
jgi:radical SAM superfamily enzyme YgiQ (UPF0313 family)